MALSDSGEVESLSRSCLQQQLKNIKKFKSVLNSYSVFY